MAELLGECPQGLDALGQRHLLDLALDERDAVGEAVVGDDLARLLDDARAVDADDARRARARGEHREDARAAPNVEHDLVLEEVRVLLDGVQVCSSAGSAVLAMRSWQR